MQIRRIVFVIIVLANLVSCSTRNEQAKMGNSLEQEDTKISDPDLFVGKNKAEVMVLGVFHFHNPGLDAYKPKYPFDILESSRQDELELLLQQLARYKPTKILVEWDRIKADSIANVHYQSYLRGTFSIDDKRNEVYQIGFRLAKMLTTIPQKHGCPPDIKNGHIL